MSDSAYAVDLGKLNLAISNKIRMCPACQKQGSLSVMPTLMELREFHNGDFVLGGTPIIPLAVLTCSNCGNTLLINALTTGLISNDSDPGGR